MSVGLRLAALRVLGMSAGEWARFPEAGATAEAQASRTSEGQMAEALPFGK